MHRLKTLIILKKTELNERKNALSILQQQKSAIQEALRNIKTEYTQEIEQINPIYFASDYMQNTIHRINHMQSTLEKINKQISESYDHIQYAFTEMRKFEIILENKVLEHKQKLTKYEENLLDEVMHNLWKYQSSIT